MEGWRKDENHSRVALQALAFHVSSGLSGARCNFFSFSLFPDSNDMKGPTSAYRRDQLSLMDVFIIVVAFEFCKASLSQNRWDSEADDELNEHPNWRLQDLMQGGDGREFPSH